MPEIILRSSQPGDEEYLKQIWKLSFHDDDGFINLFFDRMYNHGMATLAELGGLPVSAIYTLWGARLILGNLELECPYMYSLGTMPQYRGRGFGAAVASESCRRALNNGGNMAWLLPSSQGLISWYARFIHSRFFCQVRRRSFAASELTAVGATLEPVDADSYNRLRETLLFGKPHIAFDSKLIAWQEHMCKAFDGGLYLVRSDDSVGCVCAEYDSEGNVAIKELLLPDGNILAAATAIFRKHPAKMYHLRTPAFWCDDEFAPVSDFTMSAGPPGCEYPLTDNVYWGLAFD